MEQLRQQNAQKINLNRILGVVNTLSESENIILFSITF